MLKVLKGYYHRPNHCLISGSTGDPGHYWVGHWRVCRSSWHACEQERQAEGEGRAVASSQICKTRMQRASKVGEYARRSVDLIHTFQTSHRKLLTIFLTCLAFSCILSLHTVFSLPHPGLSLLILRALHLPSALHSSFFFLMRASLKTLRQPPPSTVVRRIKGIQIYSSGTINTTIPRCKIARSEI